MRNHINNKEEMEDKIMSNKVELNEKEMSNVLGGLKYDEFAKTIGTNTGGLDYHYNDFSQVEAYFNAHVGEYSSAEARDAGLIEGMLKAGIIY